LPTHNKAGKELSQEIRNKLKKEQAKQDGVYKKWLEAQGEGQKQQ
jgi:hypothetical protein